MKTATDHSGFVIFVMNPTLQTKTFLKTVIQSRLKKSTYSLVMMTRVKRKRRDVKQNTWMKVDDMTTLDTINGKTIIVYLKKSDGTVIKAWTTKIMSKNLYIMSLGEKTADHEYITTLG